MREGLNPEKDKMIKEPQFNHQVVIPVYIPSLNDYFKDAEKILSLCIDSVVSTSHSKTFITIVDNGSCSKIGRFLDDLKLSGKVHEVLHTGEMGKLNAIMKGIAGHNFALITISDSDILFKPGWQLETSKVFNIFPKCGVVGLIPQYNMFSNFCTPVLFDNFFNKRARFIKVIQPEEMRKFYESLGWNMDDSHPYLDYAFAITKENITAYIGSSHVVATYRRELLEQIPRFFKFKMGGDSERYLDRLAKEKDLWKLTTSHNYAYHMGNVYEDWMQVQKTESPDLTETKPLETPKKYPGKNLLKNRIFKKIIRVHKINQLFFLYKKLPKSKLKNFSRIFY